MQNAILIAAETYSNMIGNMTVAEVLNAIQAGNDVVLRSVLMLMEVTA